MLVIISEYYKDYSFIFNLHLQSYILEPRALSIVQKQDSRFTCFFITWVSSLLWLFNRPLQSIVYWLQRKQLFARDFFYYWYQVKFYLCAYDSISRHQQKPTVCSAFTAACGVSTAAIYWADGLNCFVIVSDLLIIDGRAFLKIAAVTWSDLPQIHSSME